MKPIFFATQSDFRKWLEKNHNKAAELLVGYYKVSSGKPGMTWSQSVDQALCFGWIDGIRNKFNEDSYTIRFTPRKPGSTWSAINIRKVEDLINEGLMYPAGIEAFSKRLERKSEIYSYENRNDKLDSKLEKQLMKNKKAWKFFCSQAPWYQKTVSFWIMSSKLDKTKQKRLETLIKDCEAGRKIKPMSYGTKK